MMPIIFTVLGICLGVKIGKSLHSGLFVGVGFVGLSVITALLTTSLGPALTDVVKNYDLKFGHLRYGLACCCFGGLQHGSRCIGHSCLLGCEHLDAHHQNYSNGEYRFMELLAFRLYRCYRLLHYSESVLGISLLLSSAASSHW
jgi:hypothetical protein